MRTLLSQYLEQHERDLFRFLRELVLQPSYSWNKKGVDSVGKIISRELAALPMNCTQSKQSELGNHLIFRSHACTNNLQSILLVGHMDTVFPPNLGFDWYREENGRVFGPGVVDMKGGLATAVFALKALHACGLLSEIPITFICNGDEEIGSPSSTELISRVARESLFAMVFECGGLNGQVVTGRKGRAGYVLDVKGRAGHAAFAIENKASAILRLAHHIIAIEKLNDPVSQLVVNVGTVMGGIGPNTVAEDASAQIDIRFLTVEDGQRCDKNLRRIAEDFHVQNTHTTLTMTSFRRPMEQSTANTKLFEHVRHEAEILQLPISSELRRGVSDANTIAEAGTPVLDGLGPIGDCDHSSNEYMIRESLPQRTLLAANSIFACWQHYRMPNLYPS